MPDTCGIPNKANYHLFVVTTWKVPGGTDTSYTDIYLCEDHLPALLGIVDDGWLYDVTGDGDMAYYNAAHSLLKFDGADKVDVLQFKVTRLR
jgi:hypothetical protein